MNNVVECDCGHIFVTKKEKTQCKCGKRFDIGVHGISLPSINKSQVISELKSKIKKQELFINQLMKKNFKNYEETRKLYENFIN